MKSEPDQASMSVIASAVSTVVQCHIRDRFVRKCSKLDAQIIEYKTKFSSGKNVYYQI